MKINPVQSLKHSIWLIFLLGMTLTLFMSNYFHRSRVQELNRHFDAESEEILRIVQRRLERYEHALIQARAFLMQAEPITNQIFQEYLENTELMKRYPGMQALAYVKKFSSKSNSDTGVWPQNPKGELTSIVYIAPMDWRNKRALGYNMMTEPIRRLAMEKARDSGKAAISGKLVLMQENNIDTQPDFIIFVPIYGKTIPSTLSQRRLNLTGYVTSPFRIGDLLNAILPESAKSKIDFEIYQGKEVSPSTLLYETTANRPYNDRLHQQALRKEISIGDNIFQVNFYFTQEFVPKSGYYSPLLAGTLGLLVTLLLMWVFYLTHRQVEINRQALSERDEFLSIASHELKTPITSLQLQLQMIRRGVKPELGHAPSPEKLALALDNSVSQVDRINRLIADLLEISKLQRGKLTYYFEVTNLAQLIHSTFDLHREQLLLAGNGVEFNLDESLNLECDKFRMEQVITNLITNAIKYGKGSIITVTLSRQEVNCILSIKDQGQGIPQEFQEKIFERFERASASRNISGLGLGLYISQQIIRTHQGRIRVESQEGNGSEFIIILPLKQTKS